MRKKNSTHPNQLVLPGIESAPPKVRAHGLREAHTYPLVSRGNRQGRPFTSFRVPASEAWTTYPEIEFRTPNSQPCIVPGRGRLERARAVSVASRSRQGARTELDGNAEGRRRDAHGLHARTSRADRAGHAGRADPGASEGVGILR